MPQPLNQQKRDDLLRGVVDYIHEHGVVGLSLRPLATALGTSPRMLLYYFGSKEELLVRAFTNDRPDLATLAADISTVDELREVALHIWAAISVGPLRRSTAVLLQVMGFSTTDTTHTSLTQFAANAVPLWTDPLTDVLCRCGIPRPESLARATILVSGLRGMLLDQLATGDTERTDAAAHLMIDMATRPAATNPRRTKAADHSGSKPT